MLSVIPSYFLSISTMVSSEIIGILANDLAGLSNGTMMFTTEGTIWESLKLLSLLGLS